MYCSTEQVYRATNLSEDQVSLAAVKDIIRAKSVDVDNFTNTTYWKRICSGTADSSTGSILTDDSLNLLADGYVGYYIHIYQGTGAGDIREVVENTATTITVDRDFSSDLDSTSKYRLFFSATSPYFSESIDGSGVSSLFLNTVPIHSLESVNINDTTVSVSNVYVYKDEGKLQLARNAEFPTWYSGVPQACDIALWWGVSQTNGKLPYNVERYCVVLSALSVLEAQMGGTYDTPSTYSMPEGSVTIGQAYVNIRGTYDVLMKEKADLESNKLIRYAVIL